MSTGDHGEKPYELTHNPAAGTYGFICREHALHRAGLTHQHAVNLEAKHLREQHADPLALLALDLKAAALMVLRANVALDIAPETPNPDARARIDLWAALCGVEDEGKAIELAKAIHETEGPVSAVVVPL